MAGVLSKGQIDDSTQAVPGAAPSLDPPGTGAVLHGRYRLDRRIGRGGMADVFAGEDLLLHRPVAVKVFRFDTPGVDHDRIDAEMRTIAQLSHPGIVTIYDADAGTDTSGPSDQDTTRSSDTIPYLVMELVEGDALADRLAGGPLPPDEVCVLATQLSGTLAYLHECGVVHRDIKPANVLLQRSRTDAAVPFRARLTDFGIARLVDSPHVTTVGMTIGTANYLSPEQVVSSHVGPAADIYSLGLVLVEALTGRIAYPGLGVEAAAARLHRAPHIPTTFGPRWARLLTAMTAREPGRRPTAAEIAAQLGQWSTPDAPDAVDAVDAVHARTEHMSGTTDARPASTRPLTRTVRRDRMAPTARRRWWSKPLVWAGAAVAVVVALALGLALSQGGGIGRPSPAPTTSVHYPSVPGRIGEHLRHLENAVG